MAGELRIGIVGSDESRWTEKQKWFAKWWIKKLIEGERLYNIAIIPIDSTHVKRIDHSGKKVIRKIIIVSGRCPKSICENCGNAGISDITDPLEGYVKCEKCGKKKKRRYGGVDIWAEVEAIKQGVEVDIKNPLCTNEEYINHGHDEFMHDFNVPSKHYWEYHYKPRNENVAEDSNVVVCFVPGTTSSCYHCREKGHSANGGCWTRKHAKQLGKETYLVVIK